MNTNFNKDEGIENTDIPKQEFPRFPDHLLDDEDRKHAQGIPQNPYAQPQGQYAVPPVNYTMVQFQEDPARQAFRMQGIKSLIFGALSFFIFYPIGLLIWPLMLAGIGFNIAGVVLGKKSSQGNYEGGAVGFWVNVILLPLGIIATIITGLFWVAIITSSATSGTGYYS